MTYANLLVTVQDGPESDSRLELGCDIATAFGARLTGLAIGALAPPYYDPMSGGAMIGELLILYRDMAEADVARARSRFQEIVNERGIGADWRGEIGVAADVCVRLARAADLVILGSRSDGRAPDVADVVLSCGRPVLATPSSRLRNPIGEPALIAWKDCREARLAVAAAIPLLQRARGVTLYGVRAADDAEADDEMADVVRYLARHEIVAEPVTASHGAASVGRRILDEALARRAGLIVAGAYGHARLREWALGGVTRDLIHDSPVCLCLAH